jgi:hypothetical protein
MMPVKGVIMKLQLNQTPEVGKPPNESVITLKAAKIATRASVLEDLSFLQIMLKHQVTKLSYR